jgi:hypothetical protein
LYSTETIIVGEGPEGWIRTIGLYNGQKTEAFTGIGGLCKDSWIGHGPNDRKLDLDALDG